MTDQPDELVITLKKPITVGTLEVTEITLREPTAAEWKTWDKLSGVEADIAAISKVASQPKAVVEQMVASQLVQGAAYIAGFMRAAPPTGLSE